MHILIDTREQTPWRFGEHVTTTTVGLPVGDYTVAGREADFCIERKSLSDFAKSITGDRARFMRELTQMSRMKRACIVVEAGIPEALEVVGPNAIDQAASFHLFRGVPTFFCGTRPAAAEFAYRWLKQAIRLA